jgi:hypothetical protein
MDYGPYEKDVIGLIPGLMGNSLLKQNMYTAKYQNGSIMAPEHVFRVFTVFISPHNTSIVMN